MNSKGFAPIVVIALIALIGLGGFITFKNIPLNEPQATPEKGFQATSSATKKQSPTPKSKTNNQTLKTSTPLPSQKPLNNPSNSSSENNSNSTSQSSTNANSNSAQTPSPSSATNNSLSQPTSNPTPSTGINVSASCSNAHDYYGTPLGNHLDFSATGKVTDQKKEGYWNTLTDESTGQTIIVAYTQGPDVGLNFHQQVSSIRGETPIVLQYDGRNYTLKVYSAPYTSGKPSLSNPLNQASFSQNCNF